jgi:transposase
MGASIGSGPEIGPPMGAQLVAGATSPARASQVIAVDHRRPFEAHLGNTVRARVERSFAWATRFRRLVKDHERYASTLADLHVVAFVCLMLRKAAQLAAGS